MDDLIKYLLQFTILSPEQIALVRSKARWKTIRKGAYFSEAGRVSTHIGYIVSGVFRVVYYNNLGEDFTRYFIYENRFVADINSFRDEIPSSEYIEALTPCKLLVFSKEEYGELENAIAGWNNIFYKITSYVMEFN